MQIAYKRNLRTIAACVVAPLAFSPLTLVVVWFAHQQARWDLPSLSRVIFRAAWVGLLVGLFIEGIFVPPTLSILKRHSAMSLKAFALAGAAIASLSYSVVGTFMFLCMSITDPAINTLPRLSKLLLFFAVGGGLAGMVFRQIYLPHRGGYEDEVSSLKMRSIFDLAPRSYTDP